MSANVPTYSEFEDLMERVAALEDAQTPTPPSNPLSLPPVPWYGGPSYYSKFAQAVAGGWTDPTFFPVAVFYGKPEHAPQLKAVGVNTYLGAEHDGSAISVITGQGHSVIAQPEWTSAEVGNDPKVVGWHTDDEIEMNESYGDDSGRLAKHKEQVAALRAKNDGRFIQTNYGNGVLETYWAPGTMPQYVVDDDLTSVDKYFYTSSQVRFEGERSDAFIASGIPSKSARAYGWQQDQMEKFQEPDASKPNWVFVETAKPYLTEDGATTITTGQLEGAVWNALIHGAAGVLYFQHNNDGVNGNYSLVEGEAARKAKVTSVNAKVKSLAPILNTQSYAWNFGAGVDTMLKVVDGFAYIFAMPIGGTGTKTFTLPPGVNGTQVTVVSENRSITVSGGKFTDPFPNEYTHHVYKIAL
jgi:hypothetical protein